MADSTPAPVVVNVTFGQAREAAESRMMASGSGKKAKGDVTYRASFGAPKCGGCVHGVFDPGANVGSCSKVEGDVRYQMVCDEYLSRTAQESDSEIDPA